MTQPIRWMLAAMVLMAGLAACSPRATQESPAGDAVMTLNPCDLLTADEVQATLGEAVAGEFNTGVAACYYQAGSGDVLVVSAAQGDRARSMMTDGLMAQLAFVPKEEARNRLIALQREASEKSVAEVVDEATTINGLIGFTVEAQEGVEDRAYWTWNGDINLAQYTVVRGDQVFSIASNQPDLDTAKTVLGALMTSILSKAPASFTVGE